LSARLRLEGNVQQNTAGETGMILTYKPRFGRRKVNQNAEAFEYDKTTDTLLAVDDNGTLDKIRNWSKLEMMVFDGLQYFIDRGFVTGLADKPYPIVYKKGWLQGWCKVEALFHTVLVDQDKLLVILANKTVVEISRWSKRGTKLPTLQMAAETPKTQTQQRRPISIPENHSNPIFH
jgi:hypothetical protein